MATNIDFAAINSANTQNMIKTLLSPLTSNLANNNNGVGSLFSLLGLFNGQQNTSSFFAQQQSVNMAELNLNTAAMAMNSANATSIFGQNSAPSTDTSNIVTAVKNFVNVFNASLTSLTAGSSTSAAAQQSASNLTGLATDNTDALANIGITVGSDGTLTLDETKLQSALAAQPDAAQSAFNASGFAANIQGEALGAINQTIGLTGTSNFMNYYMSGLQTQLAANSPLTANTGVFFNSYA